MFRCNQDITTSQNWIPYGASRSTYLGKRLQNKGNFFISLTDFWCSMTSTSCICMHCGILEIFSCILLITSNRTFSRATWIKQTLTNFSKTWNSTIVLRTRAILIVMHWKTHSRTFHQNLTRNHTIIYKYSATGYETR
jgi:hypothetical protein